MKILITYDVSQSQPEVKKELMARGFFDDWIADEKTYYMPNTTLWHPNLTGPDEAKRIIHDVIAKLNLNEPANKKIRIERFIAVPCESWSGIEGDPHAE